ncbi:hypothetical protein vseg_014789 [Gypsophila vaccaria]
MMSLFSSFDALYAESTGLWNKSFPFSPATSTATRVDHAPQRECNDQVVDDKKAAKKIITRTTNNNKNSPRFAVEFDGLHCFETILPC